MKSKPSFLSLVSGFLKFFDMSPFPILDDASLEYKPYKIIVNVYFLLFSVSGELAIVLYASLGFQSSTQTA